MKRIILLVGLVWLATLGASADTVRTRRYVVSEHGAVADAKTVNTHAIQALIDRCSREGGGVIVVPKGTFLSGALFFKPGVDLVIEKDGVLKSTTAKADFPAIYTRWEGMSVTGPRRF